LVNLIRLDKWHIIRYHCCPLRIIMAGVDDVKDDDDGSDLSLSCTWSSLSGIDLVPSKVALSLRWAAP